MSKITGVPIVRIYEKDQAKVLLSYWDEEITHFIVGGPATGNEAQFIKQHYPKITCIGYEPDTAMYQAAAARKFPGELINKALWRWSGRLMLHKGCNPLSSSVVRPAEELYVVPAVTLNMVKASHKIEGKVALWLDIEGAELHVLYGGDMLLSQVCILNVETTVKTLPRIESCVSGYGLVPTYKWNTRKQPGRMDMVFTRKGKK